MERISVNTAGDQANGDSFGPALSGAGRLVVFASEATNLVPGDTNGQMDIFVRDRLLGTTERLSLAPGGAEADGASRDAELSPDGRFVVYTSAATNLVAGDTNGKTDVFLLDRETGVTELVSRAPGGAAATGDSYDASVSADGRFVAFTSKAANLVAGGEASEQVYLLDRSTGTITHVSAATPFQTAAFGATISADGRSVAYQSNQTEIIRYEDGSAEALYATSATVWNRETGARVFVNDDRSFDGTWSSAPDITDTGATLALTGYDWPTAGRVFDVATGTGRWFSPASPPGAFRGEPAQDHIAEISGDGRYALIQQMYWVSDSPTSAYGQSGIFVWDRATGTSAHVSQGIGTLIPNSQSENGAIGAHGRLIAFDSFASDLLPDDTNDRRDVFLEVNPLFTRNTTQLLGLSYLAESVSGGAEADLYDGKGGNDTLVGQGGADVLAGGDGDDSLSGGEDDDWLTPGAGHDTARGGAGADMVSFVDATARAVIDLAAGTARIGAETDRLSDIEHVTGTIYGDLITGDGGANRLRGLGDYDWFVGSGGGDTFEGGTGRDTVAYSAATAGIAASLTASPTHGTGSAGQAAGDRYLGVENLTGSSHADSLTGDGDRNILRGLGGDDFLFGLGGHDTLDGGRGNDSIAGGLGNDRITGNIGRDTIDGGAGWDTALYSGARADYAVTVQGPGAARVVHSLPGGDGTDFLTGIEVIQFADGRIFL